VANTLTDFLKSELANWLLRGQAPAVFGTFYLALFTADPGPTGSMASEVAAAEYARQVITFGAPAPAGVVANDAIILFPDAVSGWGTITWVGIMDTLATGGGTVRQKFQLPTPIAIAAGSSFKVPVGAGVATVAG
jgi:hypothetical protein